MQFFSHCRCCQLSESANADGSSVPRAGMTLTAVSTPCNLRPTVTTDISLSSILDRLRLARHSVSNHGVSSPRLRRCLITEQCLWINRVISLWYMSASSSEDKSANCDSGRFSRHEAQRSASETDRDSFLHCRQGTSSLSRHCRLTSNLNIIRWWSDTKLPTLTSDTLSPRRVITSSSGRVAGRASGL